jgi:hypothetical protein
VRPPATPLLDTHRISTLVHTVGLSEGTADAERDQAVHRLGNLTLVSGQLNSKISNGPWSSKRPVQKEHDVLRLNLDLLDDAIDIWDEDKIRRRADDRRQPRVDLGEPTTCRPKVGGRGCLHRALSNSVPTRPHGLGSPARCWCTTGLSRRSRPTTPTASADRPTVRPPMVSRHHPLTHFAHRQDRRFTTPPTAAV